MNYIDVNVKNNKKEKHIDLDKLQNNFNILNNLENTSNLHFINSETSFKQNSNNFANTTNFSSNQNTNNVPMNDKFNINSLLPLIQMLSNKNSSQNEMQDMLLNNFGSSNQPILQLLTTLMKQKANKSEEKNVSKQNVEKKEEKISSYTKIDDFIIKN